MQAAKPPPQITELANHCRRIIFEAGCDGIEVDDGNVVDLCADNLPDEPLDSIRDALVVAGLAARFPKATSHHGGK